jgi:hypothetical protein
MAPERIASAACFAVPKSGSNLELDWDERGRRLMNGADATNKLVDFRKDLRVRRWITIFLLLADAELYASRQITVGLGRVLVQFAFVSFAQTFASFA